MMLTRSSSSNIPTVLVVFGATGDLMQKKIVPSIFHLFEKQMLPKQFHAVGFARKELGTAQFQDLVQEMLAKHQDIRRRAAVKKFLGLFSYLQGDFGSAPDYDRLVEVLRGIDAQWGVCANKLLYFAVPPAHYKVIFRNLARVKLNLSCGGQLGWTRVLIEKPFGHDLKSSRELDQLLSSYFKEEQLYRIDHYLAKEIVQGILHFRFSNNLFERSWSNALVERVEVRLLETIGVEDRGAFYDDVGAFRDVGQNHLLEMLAALTMEYPRDMDPLTLRRNRAAMLATLSPWTEKAVQQHTFRAQYRGYREIKGVQPRSETETYFALKTELQHRLWKDVPIILEAGKRCAEARKEIVVTLKHPPACLFCEPGKHTQNQVIFQLEPSDQIVIKFWTKKSGFQRILEERAFTFFLYEKEDRTPYAEEYAKLLVAAMAGDQTLFVASEEVEALWQFTDPVVAGWKQGLVPLASYAPGTTPRPALIEEQKRHDHKATPYTIGMVGLGKMGANLARRMAELGWRVVGYNRSPESTQQLANDGIIDPAYSLPELVGKLKTPRIVWLMVPAGKAVDEVLSGKGGLMRLLKKGDVVIDGGNSFYKDTARRAEVLAKHGLRFIDVGVSGGPSGARHGPCLMIGGPKDAFVLLQPLFRELALTDGYQFFEGAGAGHFVKMVHNGIEYGMMQAIAEGFTILKKSEYKLNLTQIAEVYNHGSVIESRLVDWLKKAFDLHGEDLRDVSSVVGHTGEGAWTAETAQKMKLKARVIEEAMQFRIQSEQNPNYTGKIVSALREQFGGHSIKLDSKK